MQRAILGFAILAIWAVATAAVADRDRVALILGLGDYETIVPLKNTVNDATDMAATLEGIGFDVTLALNSTSAELYQLLDDFAFRSETADLALIYFAGHGVEFQGENFLIPVDARIKTNLDVKRQSISLTQMLKAVERARQMRIVILDSCRNNPLGDLVNLSQPDDQAGTGSTEGLSRNAGGLAPVDPDRGTLVAFAAKDGQVALDGSGRNSPYAEALMEKFVLPGLEISLMFRQVRDRVLEKTGNLQEPYTYGSLTGVPFYLAGAAEGQSDVSGLAAPEAWTAIQPDQEQQMIALADLGDTRSMVGLAKMKLSPNHERFNADEGISFLERAAKAGSAEAQFLLAANYEKGVGVPRNERRALELYLQAASQDYPSALNELGFMHYQGGLGLPANPKRALLYFERAADLRLPEAQFNFAALIDDGLIPEKGPEDAAAYLYSALRSGNRDVFNILMERPNQFKPETRRALQAQLQKYEFYSGDLDGEFGARTQRGIRRAYGIDE